MTKRLAVLGSPIAHSKSPQINRAAFEFLGVDATYEKHELSIGISDWIDRSGVQWDLLAVTMPLKEEATLFASESDEASTTTNSTNCLLWDGSNYLGFNTDPMGLRLAVGSVEFERVGILGTGATARSALFAFKGYPVSIWGRSSEKAGQLAEKFGANSSSWDEALAADLVVSTLPIGVLPTLLGGFGGKTLLDVAYKNGDFSKFETRISGIEMLIWQAIGQLRLLLNSGAEFEDEQALHDLMLAAANMEE